jgi:hypothetical protein
MGGAGVDAGATTLVYLATSPNVDTVTGRYFVDKREMKSSAASRDRAVQERLWQISTQLTGLDE